jgi:3-oxoacyl-[acyl-carrier-protein] synthase III
MSRKQEQRVKHARQQWVSDIQWLMSNQAGRRFIQNLCDRAGLESSPMTGNSWTYHKIGEQQFMATLMREIRIVALADVRLMEDETIANQNFDRQLREQPDDTPEG